MYFKIKFSVVFLCFLLLSYMGNLPQKGKIYFDDGKYSGAKLLEYDPTQPVSSNNPKSTGIIERGNGLAISPVLGSSDTTLTFTQVLLQILLVLNISIITLQQLHG